MAGHGDTICAVATAPGTGAIGIVRASGPGVRQLLAELCPNLRLSPRRLRSTRLVDGDAVVDQVLVCLMPAPRSYTGEDVVEIHGHGGALNMRRIVELCVARGARLAEPGEFTRRAFLNGRMDLAQAEAVAQVIQARSDRALQNAQAVLAGELGQRLDRVRRALVELSARLESMIDFADDDPEGSSRLEACLDTQHERVEHSIAALLQTYTRGRRLDGATVALVGATNAGKSSLFNRLLDSERALVSALPGTTRDYIEADVAWGPHRVTLVDTAGTRPSGQRAQETDLERAGRGLAASILARCDAVVQVVDLGEPRPEVGAGLAGDGADLVVAANKIDLVDGTPQEIEERLGLAIPGVPVVATSAKTGQGIDTLARTLGRLLHGRKGQENETACVTVQRHHDALQGALEAVRQGRASLSQGYPPEVAVEHARQALDCIRQITGETFTEEVLDSVFSSFCIGK